MPFPPSSSDLARRFALVIDGLCGATAARIAADRSAGPLLILIVARLRRLAARFASLAARAQAGPLPPPRRRPAAPRPARTRRNTLPDRFAWLIRLVPATAAYGGQVQALLSDPDMVALLEAAPQAGRLLRPLCRMMALRPGPALLPPRPERVARADPLPGPAAARTDPPASDPPASDPPSSRPAAVVRRPWRSIRMPMSRPALARA